MDALERLKDGGVVFPSEGATLVVHCEGKGYLLKPVAPWKEDAAEWVNTPHTAFAFTKSEARTQKELLHWSPHNLAVTIIDRKTWKEENERASDSGSGNRVADQGTAEDA